MRRLCFEKWYYLIGPCRSGYDVLFPNDASLPVAAVYAARTWRRGTRSPEACRWGRKCVVPEGADRADFPIGCPPGAGPADVARNLRPPSRITRDGRPGPRKVMTMSYSEILYDEDGPVGTITMNRPNNGNSFTMSFRTAF